ncbi:MAG: DM13 domain-containing protein [Acidobacteria bacterium]|nr:DM13 domain-containing protein [Acidobacteriota bacterium]MBS1866226.1 DM13 domain-containing protein [Acidobacteriota bacterium]
MNTKQKSWIKRNKWILVLVAIPVLSVAWYEFRPEKLFINQTVSEAAPFMASGDPQPVYTGILEGKAHPTTGRATIYQTPDGKSFLRLSDFATSNGPDVHVVLLKSGEKALAGVAIANDLDKIELGSLKGNQGDQNYDLPAATDLNKYQTVAIYCERFHVIFGASQLEKF